MSLRTQRATLFVFLAAAGLLGGGGTHAAEAPGSDWLDPGFGVATTCYEGYGDPSSEEQELLEHMNRARRDPVGEGDRAAAFYRDVSLQSSHLLAAARLTGVPEFTPVETHDAITAIPPAPPLVFDGTLIDVARAHAQVMSDLDQQTFQGPGEAVLEQRVVDAGYPDGATFDEFIYGYGREPLNIHGVFMLDVGQPVDATTGRRATGHRDTIMDPDFIEIGVGIVDRQRTDGSPPLVTLGPKVVTIDFSKPLSPLRYVTGVCYVDLDGDGAYGRDEGIEGVRVETDATSEYTITSSSGGYAIPVTPGIGEIQVRATGRRGHLSARFGVDTKTVNVGDNSVKVDFVVPFEFPQPTRISASFIDLDDGETTVIDLPIAESEPAVGRVHRVDLDVGIGHSDRADLTLVLESPDGRLVTLIRGGSPGVDFRGSFPLNLAPVEDMRAFAGAPVSGTWRLHVTDAAAGGVGRVDAVMLHVLPEQFEPIESPLTGLRLTRLRLRNSKRSGRDRVEIAGTIDAYGNVLQPAEGAEIRIRVPGDGGAEILRAVLVGDDVNNAPLKVRSKFRWNRKGTTRTTFTATIKRASLPALPERVIVELHLGGVIVAEDVPLYSNGRLAGQFASPSRRDPELRLSIDRVTTSTRRGVRVLKVRAKMSVPPGLVPPPVLRPIVFPDGRAHLRIGRVTMTAPVDPAPFARRGWANTPLADFAVSPEHKALLAQPEFALLHDPYAEIRSVSINFRTGGVIMHVPAAEALLDGTVLVRLRIGSHVAFASVGVRTTRRGVRY